MKEHIIVQTCCQMVKYL